MAAGFRPAKAGDICVLLEPPAAEFTQLREQQIALQRRFDGRLHERIHLTVQRFALPDERVLREVVKGLEAVTATVRSFRITATSLTYMHSSFWDSYLLRWCIEPSVGLCQFEADVERVLTASGVTPHYQHKSGWGSSHVTALEAVPQSDLDRTAECGGFPHLLLAF